MQMKEGAKNLISVPLVPLCRIVLEPGVLFWPFTRASHTLQFLFALICFDLEAVKWWKLPFYNISSGTVVQSDSTHKREQQ